MTTSLLEKKHVVIGTAGHIDHGKTQLVKSLTGIDADALIEEKRRGITIELGFIFMETPGIDKQIVFIDVPGHEKLIKTMVAGASNIDAALLVIAADEGVSVQTREHLDILQLLGIQRGIIALTKTDLVDEHQISELQAKVRGFVKGTFLNDAPIIPLSTVTGSGVDELKSVLINIAQQVSDRADSGIFRMPIDRVFTMRGFGTVIAGTVLSGKVEIGDKIEIFPDGIKAKVRGIHVHHQKTDRSSIGKRTALNLLNIEKDRLHRGQTAGLSGSLVPTYRLDGKLLLLKSCGKELKNKARIRLHTGTAEIICRLVLLDRDKLSPGESAFAQFVLEAPAVALRQDRFVIRTFSPLMTIGGGLILDSTPRKHKRFDSQTIEGLRRFEGNLNEVVEQMFLKSAFTPQSSSEVALKIGKEEKEVTEAVRSIWNNGKLVKVDSKKEKYLHQNFYQRLTNKLLAIIENYFTRNPHQLLMPYVELRSEFMRLSGPQTFYSILAELCKDKLIIEKDSQVGLKGYEIKMKPHELKLAETIEKIFREAGFKAPLEEEVRKNLGITPDVLKKTMNFLTDKNRLIRLSDKVVYHRDSLKAAEAVVINKIRKNQSITVAELRDELRLSRKYTQAVLEYFDKIGLTKREEDKHLIR